MTMKKLKLNKQRIAKLSNQEASSVMGGGTDNSTNRGFTCCWCTGGDTTDEPTMDTCHGTTQIFTDPTFTTCPTARGIE